MTAVKPFLRWAGGKTRALPAILPLIPPAIHGVYREIFLGGGAVFFHLASVGQGELVRGAVLSDVNADLINAYRYVRDQPLTMLRWLKICQSENCEKYYYATRESPAGEGVLAAVRFIYLNKTCFNGLHRVNRAGKFNVPWGKLKNPDIMGESNLLACSRALQGVELEVCGFETALAQAQAGDFVYADPPYLYPSPGAFTAYSGKFSAEHAVLLSVHMGRAQCRGARGLISNADNELTRQAFSSPPGAPTRTFQSLDVRRSVGASAKTRKIAPEILVECPAI